MSSDTAQRLAVGICAWIDLLFVARLPFIGGPLSKFVAFILVDIWGHVWIWSRSLSTESLIVSLASRSCMHDQKAWGKLSSRSNYLLIGGKRYLWQKMVQFDLLSMRFYSSAEFKEWVYIIHYSDISSYYKRWFFQIFWSLIYYFCFTC